MVGATDSMDFTLSNLSAGRLDRALAAALPELSRSQLQRLIEGGQVTVTGRAVTKPGFRLSGGEQVTVRVPPPAPSTAAAEDIPLDVVYEDNNVLVINKPAGMVVHPAAGHASGTLVNAVLGYDADLEGVGDERRPGIVHRLDKDTSGLILVAKKDAAHRHLQRQFAERKVDKVYLALLDGGPPTDVGRIDAPIGRDARDRQRMAIVAPDQGREAVTDFKVLERFDPRGGRQPYTWVEAHPHTGRTHQIRVHFSYLRCPIVGDTVYGRAQPTLPVNRHCLHAARLSVVLPGEREATTFEAPLPAEIEHLFDLVRG
jgi:23S rRNA pseudouridine1911/1915/1917 synthase